MPSDGSRVRFQELSRFLDRRKLWVQKRKTDASSAGDFIGEGLSEYKSLVVRRWDLWRGRRRGEQPAA